MQVVAVRSDQRCDDATQGKGVPLEQAGEVTVVKTAEALQESVVAGMPHIEIHAHLDLAVLDFVQDAWNYPSILGDIPKTVKSIRVRCCPPAPRWVDFQFLGSLLHSTCCASIIANHQAS